MKKKTLKWTEYSSSEAKNVYHAAFRICYQVETQSLLLLFNYMDFSENIEKWEWRLIRNFKTNNIHTYETEDRMNPPFKWANRILLEKIKQS